MKPKLIAVIFGTYSTGFYCSQGLQNEFIRLCCYFSVVMIWLLVNEQLRLSMIGRYCVFPTIVT